MNGSRFYASTSVCNLVHFLALFFCQKLKLLLFLALAVKEQSQKQKRLQRNMSLEHIRVSDPPSILQRIENEHDLIGPKKDRLNVSNKIELWFLSTYSPLEGKAKLKEASSPAKKHQNLDRKSSAQSSLLSHLV